jgi:hypothetical protein
MFDFIKNFFGGIFSFFGGLFGFKKSEYFMDLGGSEAKESPKVEPAAKKSEAKKPEAVAVASEATEKPAKSDSPKSEKSESPKKAKAETSKKSKKEKEPVVSASAKTQEPVKVAAASNGKVSSSTQPILTFAPNNLMPMPNSGRRTPGPSMNSFREMARQVKTK